jgi:hypothetical protein
MGLMGVREEGQGFSLRTEINNLDKDNAGRNSLAGVSHRSAI